MPVKTRPRFISCEGLICHLFDYYTANGYDPDGLEVKSSSYVTQAGKTYSCYNPTTKNEKGVSSKGRYFPLTKELKEILDALKEKQKKLGIKSEWVFCKSSGEWITV